MFRTKTLLVVGAGAGCEVGFPTGEQLSKRIADHLSFRDGDFRVEGGNDEIRKALIRVARASGIDANLYLRAGRQISDGVRYSRSIDEFLNKHKDDEFVKACAKITIAKTILDYERGSPLFINPENAFSTFRNADEISKSWFLEFVRILHDGLAKENICKIADAITIVNFNYDRCIEHYLYHTLRYSYGVVPNLAAEALKAIRIIHPYGSLGKLPWQDSAGLEFGGVLGATHLIQVSQRIRTFYEQMQDDSDLDLIKTAVVNAQQIIFLGFGFHSQNVGILSTSDCSNLNNVYATAFEESPQNASVIVEAIRGMVGVRANTIPPQNIQVKNVTCEKLFREFSRVFSQM